MLLVLHWLHVFLQHKRNMPQVSRKSSGYRSFITCDDPRGVVECKNVRNPRKNLTQDQLCSKEMALSRLEKDSSNVSGSVKKQQKKVHVRHLSRSNKDPLKEIRIDERNMPSTSLSHSSVLCSSNSSWKKNRKLKRLNLIEKLMGLEDDFPRSLPSSPREKIVKHELQHSKKLDWRRRTVIQMVEGVKFRGFFTSLVNRLNDSSSLSNSRVCDCNESDDRSLIKPLRFSCLNLEHPIIPKTRGELLDLKSEEMMCNMRMRSNPLAQVNQNDTLDLNNVKENLTRITRKAKGTRARSSESHLRSQDGTLTSKRSKEAASFTNDDLVCKDERKPILIMTDSMVNASQIEITDYVDEEWSYPSESSSLTRDEFDTKNHDSESRMEKGSDMCSEHEYQSKKIKNSVDHEGSMDSKKLKALLLSNLYFVKRVEELFGLKMNTERGLKQTAYEINSNDLNKKVLLDVASEIMEFLGSQYPVIYKRSLSSLNLILDEVCEWIKDLRCYEKPGENDLSDDSLIWLVKRDLSRNRMGIRAWDIGWRSSPEEIVRGIEELVFSELIDGVIVNLSST